ASLDDSGIAGTAVHSGLLLPTARWLAGRHPGMLAFYDDGEGSDRRLLEALLEILPAAELEALADGYLGATAWRARPAGGARRDGRSRSRDVHLQSRQPCRRQRRPPGARTRPGLDRDRAGAASAGTDLLRLPDLTQRHSDRLRRPGAVLRLGGAQLPHLRHL